MTRFLIEKKKLFHDNEITQAVDKVKSQQLLVFK